MSGPTKSIRDQDSQSPDPLAAVSAAYDRLAPHWDGWSREVRPDWRIPYLDRLESRLAAGSDVLELGCGTGWPVADRLADAHNYLGLDVSTRMVEMAEQKVPTGRFRVADMIEADFPAQSFDAVIAFYSIIHVPRDSQPALFQLVHSWLKPGGYFVACLSAGDLPEGWEQNWLGGGPMFWSGYDADTNQELLAEAGFSLETSEVRTQLEGNEEARFLWIEARRPQVDSQPSTRPR